MDVLAINEVGLEVLKSKEENHFTDFKSKRITPAKLLKTLAAFANADGGDVFVGLEDPKNGWKWVGFANPEEANGHIQAFDSAFLLGAGLSYTFLSHPNESGLLLHVDVAKSRSIVEIEGGAIYARRSGRNHPVASPEEKERLRLNKGIESFEDRTVNADPSGISSSPILREFLDHIVPNRSPDEWLRKQELVVGELPTVAGIVLFDDEPQVHLPRASIKIYRYRSVEPEGSRETLASVPITIEGCAYQQISLAVETTLEISKSIPMLGEKGLETVTFPLVALHEVIANAVLHRDYSINDSVHIRIFDNRMEIESPGLLPGHVTVKNILRARAIRNNKINRIINKFKNPPNMDVGEGLNTCFQAIKAVRLKPPLIIQNEASVLVSLRHERLGSSEEAIIEYMKDHTSINNGQARAICSIEDTNKMKRVLQAMVKSAVLEQVEGRAKRNAAYIRGKNFPQA